MSYSGLNETNQYSKINLREAEASNGTINYTKVNMPVSNTDFPTKYS